MAIWVLREASLQRCIPNRDSHSWRAELAGAWASSFERYVGLRVDLLLTSLRAAILA